MGVIQLWSILEPVKEHIPLSELSGLTLAVDLSIWVCESNAIKQMQGVVAKPHLRNLFFRVSNLIQMGIKLIFAIDGEAPDLKSSTMAKRQQSRFPGKKKSSLPPKTKRKGRSQFNSILKECCELLDYLGVPYIYSRGEAEALCAFLDSQGIVDGCLTDDGDAFLYGAKTVYRNFTLNTKDPHVESYTAHDIEERLGLKQKGLIGLALLLGCDYIPKGVPGVGREQVLKLIKALESVDILDRFSSWTPDVKDLDGIEKTVWKKAMKVPEFPNQEVIDEFLITKDTCPVKPLHQRRPWIEKSTDFLYKKLDWPPEYTEEKVLPLITLWDMRDISDGRTHSTMVHLIPHRIVKRRVRQGVPCLEIEWNRQDHATEENKYYSTIEEETLFSRCFPDLVDEFVTAESNKKATKGRKKVKADTKSSLSEPAICGGVDSVIDSLDSLSLDPPKSITNNATTTNDQDENKPYTNYNVKINKPRSQELNINKNPATKNSQTSQVLSNMETERESLKTLSEISSEISKDIISSNSSSNITNCESSPPSEYVPLSQRIKLSLKSVAVNRHLSQSERQQPMLGKDSRSTSGFKDVKMLPQKAEPQNVYKNQLMQQMKIDCLEDLGILNQKESIVMTEDDSVCNEDSQSRIFKLPGYCDNNHSFRPNPTKQVQNNRSVKYALKMSMDDKLSVKPAVNVAKVKKRPLSMKHVITPNLSCFEIPHDKSSSESDKGDTPKHHNSEIEVKCNEVGLLDTQYILSVSTSDLNICDRSNSTKKQDLRNVPTILPLPIMADFNYDLKTEVYRNEPITGDSNPVVIVEDHQHLELSMNNSSVDLFSPGIAHSTSELRDEPGPIDHISSLSCGQSLSDKQLLPGALRTPCFVKHNLLKSVLFDTPNFCGNSPGYGVFNIESSLLNVTGDKLLYSPTPVSENRNKGKVPGNENDRSLLNHLHERPSIVNSSLFDDISTPVFVGKDNNLPDVTNEVLDKQVTLLKVCQDSCKADFLQIDLDHVLQNCGNKDIEKIDTNSANKDKQVGTLSTSNVCSVKTTKYKSKSTHGPEDEIVLLNESMENKENIELESCVTKMKSLSLEKLENSHVPPSSPLSLVDRLRAKMATNKQSEQLYNDTILSVKGPPKSAK